MSLLLLSGGSAAFVPEVISDAAGIYEPFRQGATFGVDNTTDVKTYSQLFDYSGNNRPAVAAKANQPVYNPNISASYAIPRTGGEDIYPILRQGGSLGFIGSGGSFGTGYLVQNRGTLDVEILELPTGQVRFRVSGTTSTTNIEIITQLTPDDSFAQSDIAYYNYRAAVLAGGFTNVNSLTAYLSGNTNTSSYVEGGGTGGSIISSLTSSLQDFEATRTLSNSNTRKCRGGLRITFNVGVAVDFTILFEPIHIRKVEPSVLPTNTAIENEGTLVVTNVGQNVTSGQAWTDFRIAGTTSTTSTTIALPFSNVDTLRAGDVVDAVAAIALVGGALTNIDAIKVGVRTNTSAMTIISTAASADIKASLTSSLQDFESATIRTTAAATNRARLFVILEFASAVTIDVTLRIAPKTIRRNNTIEFNGRAHAFFDGATSRRMRFGASGNLITLGGCNFFAGASDRGRCLWWCERSTQVIQDTT